MKKLMPSQEEPLKMEHGKGMVQPRQPLRHAVIVGIFRFESKFKKTVGDFRAQSRFAPNPAVGTKARECRVAADQLQTNVLSVWPVRLRRTEHCTDKIVVKKRRSYRQLALLQGQNSVVIPGRLPE